MSKLRQYLIIPIAIAALALSLPSLTQAATTTVSLGNAASFAVLAGTAVTNVPTSVITGDMGLSPAAGSNYGGGVTTAQVSGTIYAVDSSGPAGAAGNNPTLLTSAKNDLTAAYLDAAGRTPTTTYVTADNQLGGKTLTAGVYAFGHASTANITAASPLVLDGQGDASSVFIFQASSDLVTASSSAVQLINGAEACNVFWQVTSSATLGTSSTFVGTIMALTSVGLNTSATMSGRALARNAAVTLDHNTISTPSCSSAVATAVAAAAAAAAASASPTPTASTSSTTAATSATTSTSAATTTRTTPVPGLPSTGVDPNQPNIPGRILFFVCFLVIAYLSLRRWARLPTADHKSG